MRVHIATDHAAFEVKNAIVADLEARGYDVIDHGAEEYDSEDDYPVFVIPAAEAVIDDPGSLGVVFGGSGNGEAIAANKVPGIRAAVVYSHDTAVLAREHNDANIASIGGRLHAYEQVLDLVLAFLTTNFSNAERHSRRIDLISAYEESLTA
ncbi:MAG: ribose-5-phosphate isomerase [Propionibacteriaceae bacterium]|nr:ribose-5-phosphate isomerase [Propionibacteriaceae bacterium]